MSDPRDYNLDLSIGGTGNNPNEPAPSRPSTTPKRPFLSVQFACCNVYQRIYRSADGKSYRGRCPRCGIPVHFAVGEGGTDSRTFVVG